MLNNRYELCEKLGEGTAGSTWLVYDHMLGKEWAMKVWKQADEGMEISALKTVDSKYFPRIVEVFQENGRKYLVMDRIKGITLEEKLRKQGTFEIEEAIDVLDQICEALKVLHGMTPPLLHLDLKPANIMLTSEGVRLIDFGSALCGWNDDSARSGTVGYASPEQLKGNTVDERSDIYSLGTVLYAMLTGRKPNYRIDKKELSGRVVGIIERAMDDDRDKRFQSIQEIQENLKSVKSNNYADRAADVICYVVSGCLFFLAAYYGSRLFIEFHQYIRNGHIPEIRQILLGTVPVFSCCLWEKVRMKAVGNDFRYIVEKDCLRTGKSSRIWTG